MKLWRPLSRYENQFRHVNPEERTQILLKLCSNLLPMMGASYARVVEWCLSFQGTSEVRELAFTVEVLDKLEEMSHITS